MTNDIYKLNFVTRWLRNYVDRIFPVEITQRGGEEEENTIFIKNIEQMVREANW